MCENKMLTICYAKHCSLYDSSVWRKALVGDQKLFNAEILPSDDMQRWEKLLKILQMVRMCLTLHLLITCLNRMILTLRFPMWLSNQSFHLDLRSVFMSCVWDVTLLNATIKFYFLKNNICSTDVTQLGTHSVGLILTMMQLRLKL